MLHTEGGSSEGPVLWSRNLLLNGSLILLCFETDILDLLQTCNFLDRQKKAAKWPCCAVLFESVMDLAFYCLDENYCSQDDTSIKYESYRKLQLDQPKKKSIVKEDVRKLI